MGLKWTAANISMRYERGVTLSEMSSLGLGLMDEFGSANYGNARERGGWRGGDYVGLERLRESGIRLRETIQPCMTDVRRIGEMSNNNMLQRTECVVDG